MSKKFCSKILLFGEYTIIKGSRGLALPLSQLFGEFKKDKNIVEKKSVLDLADFCDYLGGSNLLSLSLDLDRFSRDIKEGQYFASNIPQGYGVGSSGALCAAVYASYGKDFKRKDFYTSDELRSLKDIMALMESFYHGASSGLDCLISLIDKPLLIESRNKISLIPTPKLNKHGAFFLFDSGASRKTSAFVNSFLNLYDSNIEYRKEIDQFSKTTNQMIEDFSGQSSADFKSDFRDFSLKQLDLFSMMIPENVAEVWKKGIDLDRYFFKLCGAGGGGYFLVYSPDTDLSDFDSFTKIF